MILAYTMKHLKMNVDRAYEYVKKCRPEISPNLGFMGQLLEYQKKLEGESEDIENEELNTQYYSMEYARLTPFFIEAIKELKTKLEAAEARIATLES